MDNLKEAWNNLSGRDQLALSVLGICFALFMAFRFILFPVIELKDKQKNRLHGQQAAYERVKNLAAQLKNRDASEDGFAAEGASAERSVESSFAQHGLRVSGFDASGRSGIRVRFDDVPYENLLSWLHNLEIVQGLHFKTVSVASSTTPGVVSASILIDKN
jgi:general secretion pathway protein M